VEDVEKLGFEQRAVQGVELSPAEPPIPGVDVPFGDGQLDRIPLGRIADEIPQAPEVGLDPGEINGVRRRAGRCRVDRPEDKTQGANDSFFLQETPQRKICTGKEALFQWLGGKNDLAVMEEADKVGDPFQVQGDVGGKEHRLPRKSSRALVDKGRCP